MFKPLYYGLISAAHRRPVRVAGPDALISFTFDDFPRSAYTTGGSILAAHDARGTYYTAAALAGTTNALGDQFRLEDLPSLVADGHELASHTRHHISARAVSTSIYEKEVADGTEALGPAASGNFSYPFGDITLAAKSAAARHCPSARGTQPGCNGPVADLNFLRANRLYSDSVDLTHVEHLIARHTHPGAWLIFYTHDVRDRPSPYGCTPAYFEAAVTCAQKSGARVVTITRALETITNQ